MRRDGVKHGKFRPVIAMVFADGLDKSGSKDAFDASLKALKAAGIGIKAAGPAGTTTKQVPTGFMRSCGCCEDTVSVSTDVFSIVLSEPLHMTRTELADLGCQPWTLVRELETLRHVPVDM